MKLNSILTVSCVSMAAIASAAESRPNVVLILADDMGYSDLGCMGSEISTPNLDKLAKDGVLFTNCYNTSRSCPSRAALLTGQYQWDAGMGHMNDTRSDLKEYQGYLNDESITIAEALKGGGYKTFMSGKWHVGDDVEQWPDKRGFDEYCGLPAGGGVYFYPSKFYKRTLYHNSVEVTPPADWYSTDGFTDAAVDFISREAADDEPIFMYLAYIAPHFPLQAKSEDIAKYEGRYDKGYNAVRDERIKRGRELGVFIDGAPVTESINPDWSEVKDREFRADQMEVYAAMVDCLDQNIGRVVESLKANGIFDNTIIIFLSDNGAAKSDFNKTPNAKVGTAESNTSYGKWHNVSNTPLPNGKATEFEGGISTPLIFHWGNEVAKRGEINRATTHIMDIMPTILDAANVKYPNSYNGKKLSALDGESLLNVALKGGKGKSRTLFWEHEGNMASRDGDWKLVKLKKGEWELYDLSNDPYETENLITKYPKIAKRLEQNYIEWSKKHKVSSWPLPKIKN